MHRSLVLVAVVACTDNVPPPPVGAHYHYVMSGEHVPRSNTEARNWGLDLDGNSSIDNQLGMVLATLTSMGFEIPANAERAIDRGEVVVLIDLQTSSFSNNSSAGFTLYTGTDPMPPACNGSDDLTCRHHLQGDATIGVGTSTGSITG